MDVGAMILDGPLFYVLHEDGHTAVPIYDTNDPRFLPFMSSPEYHEHRRVARTETRDYVVSTVFLMIDHNFRLDDGDDTPILWETMIFPKATFHEEYCARYATRAEAEQGHKDAVAYARMKEQYEARTIAFRVGKRHLSVRKIKDRWKIRT